MVEFKHHLFLVLIVFLIFRLPYLEVLPHWDWDEGVNQNIAWNLAEGKALWFAVKYVWVPHPPLYFMTAAIMLKTLENTIYSMRLLSVAYSLLTTILVYLVGKEIAGEKPGLLAALLYSIYPMAVYWNRMAFANNQLTMLGMTALYSTLRYAKNRRHVFFYLACITTGLAAITQYTGATLVGAFFFTLFLYDRKNAFRGLILSAIPFILFAAVMLYSSPAEFTHDLLHNKSRFGPNLSKSVYLIAYAAVLYHFRERVKRVFKTNIQAIRENLLACYLPLSLFVFIPLTEDIFMRSTDFFMLGVFGFFAVKDRRNKIITSMFFLAALSVIVWMDRADHMIMVLYPYFTLGLAFVLLRVYGHTLVYPSRFRRAGLLSLVLVFYPIAVTLYHDVDLIFFGDTLTKENLPSDYMVSAYINERTNESDVVLTYSFLSHLIDRPTNGVLTQSIVYEHQRRVAYYPVFPHERFAFNTSYLNAKYVVVTNKTLEKLGNETEFDELIETVTAWPYDQVGGYLVYRNPRK